MPVTNSSNGNRWTGQSMKYFIALLMAPVLAQAAATFDGYEAFYASLPDTVFHGEGSCA